MLFEIYPDRLVKKPALQVLVLRLFGESLKAEESGGIAFLDGYFKVAGGVEKGQLFTFSYVGIAFADLIDDLITFKDDAEAAAFAAFFEFFPGDIDDDILEMIDKDDLAFYPIVTEHGPEMILFRKRRIGCSDVQQRAAVDELLYGVAHYTGAIERILYGGLIHGQADNHLRLPLQYHCQQSIVGAKQVLVIVIGQEELFRLFFEKVDQDKMIGIRREMLNSIPADICRLWVIERGEIVGDIQYRECRVNLC